MSKRRAERAIREQLFRQLPGKREIDCPEAIQITIDIPAAVSAERKKFVEAVEDEDMLSLIQRYPIRETPALNALVTGLGFRNRAQYESTVRRLLMDDPDLLTFVRSLFGTLAEDIGAE